MSYVYHNNDGEILAVTKENILTFDESVKVITMVNLPTDVDYTFYKINSLGTLSDNIVRWKEFRKAQVSEWFEHTMATFKFQTSWGFVIDNRRSGTKNDKDNITSLLKLGLPMTPVRDSVGVDHYMNPTELTQLEREMILNGLGLYGKKWEMESAIDNATDVSLLREMVIS